MAATNRNGNHTLNLDALYGLDRPIVVRWKGKEYELLRPDAFGPKDLLHLQRLLGRMPAIQKIDTAAPTEEDAAELEQVTLDALQTIGATLAKAEPAVPFAARLKILEFWQAEIQGEVTDGPKAEPPVSTGETPTAGSPISTA